jgi:hypothetical protein
MTREGLTAALEVAKARLDPLDYLTRREILVALLKNASFMALLTGGATGALGRVVASAQSRGFISLGALTAPAPDERFRNFRTRLTEGGRALMDQIVSEVIAQKLDELGVRPGQTFGGEIRELIEGVRTDAACPGTFICDENQCGAHDCNDQKCTDSNACGSQDCTANDCDHDVCRGQGCSDESCGDNDCTAETCPLNECSDNTCDQQACRDNECDVEVQAFQGLKDKLDRYSGEPFVDELKQLFGASILREIETMIRNRTTLRGRGLLEPGAPPPPPTRSVDEIFRGLAAGRTPGLPAQPGVQPPTTPRAPAVRPPAGPPAGSPPATTPTTPTPPATTTAPPVVGPTPGATPTPPAIDPRRLQPPGGGPGSAVPAPQPKAPLQ